jgi:hypothetical protein
LGDSVVTDDMRRKFFGRSIVGVLGMDCLRHYCIQLDFTSRNIRFLDPDHLDSQSLGNAFPLADFFWDISTHADFCGVKNVRFFPDTGDNWDGVLKSKLLKQALQDQPSDQTNETEISANNLGHEVHIQKIILGGEIYTNLTFHDSSIRISPDENIIGLRLLARNLVTFNFPKRTMYLKTTNVGPLMDVSSSTNSASYALAIAAGKFLESLKKQGQLPGWQKNESGWIKAEPLAPTFGIPTKDDIYPFIVTFDRTDKNWKAIGFHYTVVRDSKDDPWKLQQVWQTDTNGELFKKYSIP